MDDRAVVPNPRVLAFLVLTLLAILACDGEEGSRNFARFVPVFSGIGSLPGEIAGPYFSEPDGRRTITSKQVNVAGTVPSEAAKQRQIAVYLSRNRDPWADRTEAGRAIVGDDLKWRLPKAVELLPGENYLHGAVIKDDGTPGPFSSLRLWYDDGKMGKDPVDVPLAFGFPSNGSTVYSSRIVARGTARPGAVLEVQGTFLGFPSPLQDLWPQEKSASAQLRTSTGNSAGSSGSSATVRTTADERGAWALPLQLAARENQLTIRYFGQSQAETANVSFHLREGLRWPFANTDGDIGTVTQWFGRTRYAADHADIERDGSVGGVHDGLDIAVGNGRNVYAVASGNITYYDDGQCGLTQVELSGDFAGYRAEYLHVDMDPELKKRFDARDQGKPFQLDAGDLLGQVTVKNVQGRCVTEGAHLHLDVKSKDSNGKWTASVNVNPAERIAGKFEPPIPPADKYEELGNGMLVPPDGLAWDQVPVATSLDGTKFLSRAQTQVLADPFGQTPQARPAVMFVHGLGETADSWKDRSIWKTLEARGYGTDFMESFQYNPPAGGQQTEGTETSVMGNAIKLRADVKGLSDRNRAAGGSGKVNIIAYSMGGLVTRTYLAFSPEGTGMVDKVFLIETPQRGSYLLQPGDWLLQQFSDSDSLAAQLHWAVLRSWWEGAATWVLNRLGVDLNMNAEAELDMVPGSMLLEEIQKPERISALPRNVQYFNWYGDIQIHFHHQLYDYVLEPFDVPVGDGVILTHEAQLPSALEAHTTALKGDANYDLTLERFLALRASKLATDLPGIENPGFQLDPRRLLDNIRQLFGGSTQYLSALREHAEDAVVASMFEEVYEEMPKSFHLKTMSYLKELGVEDTILWEFRP